MSVSHLLNTHMVGLKKGKLFAQETPRILNHHEWFTVNEDPMVLLLEFGWNCSCIKQITVV